MLAVQAPGWCWYLGTAVQKVRLLAGSVGGSAIARTFFGVLGHSNRLLLEDLQVHNWGLRRLCRRGTQGFHRRQWLGSGKLMIPGFQLLF